MQSILILQSSDEGPANRIINIDLLATAAISPENPEWTVASVGVFQVTIHMPFAKFLEKVQELIAENYRVSHETSIQWHKKRIEDQRAAMVDAMEFALGKK